jgi:hypothetical protein
MCAAAAGAGPTAAQAATYPRVSRLRPFSAQTNYMSLPGYLRYRVYVLDGVWLSRRTAAAIVHRQLASGEE